MDSATPSISVRSNDEQNSFKGPEDLPEQVSTVEIDIPQRSVIDSRDKSHPKDADDGSDMLSTSDTTFDGSSKGTDAENHPFTDQKLDPSSPLVPLLSPESLKVNAAFLAPSIVELPATPLGRPTPHAAEEPESKSFFDAFSSDDESCSLEIARTGTRTPERPILVHTRSSSSRLGRPSQATKAKAARVLGLQSATEGSNMLQSSTQVKSSDKKAGIVKGSLPSTAVTSSSSILLAHDHHQDGATIRSTSPSPRLPITPTSIIEAPPTPLRLAGLETLPSPLGGFGKLQGIPADTFQHGGLHGLRSTSPSSLLDLKRHRSVGHRQRAHSAPPFLFRTAPKFAALIHCPDPDLANKKRRNRKITISEIDIVHANKFRRAEHLRRHAGQNRPVGISLREHVVSTPYPRHDSSTVSKEGNLKKIDIGESKEGARHVTDQKNLRSSFFQEHLGTDADVRQSQTSFTQRESIHLVLQIAGHPLKRRIISIIVQDRATFDDERLFSRLRAEYRSLVGRALSLCAARRVSAIRAFPKEGGPRAFQDGDVLPVYQDPSLGRRRRTFLNFLRLQQCAPGDSLAATRSGVSNIQSQSSGQTIPLNATLRTESGSEAVASPSVLCSLPRPSIEPGSTTAAIIADTKRNHMVLEFSHAYSLQMITITSFVMVFLSIAACIFWIIFGKPGHGLQDHSHSNWGHDDAASRVVSGIVLGIILLLIGSLSEAIWLWLSWIGL